MNYLLDTHTFLCAAFAPEKLGRKARLILDESANPVALSSISLWEISLKYALDKLTLPHRVLAAPIKVGGCHSTGTQTVTALAQALSTCRRL